VASALFVHSPRLNWFEIKLKLPAKFLCAWNTYASTRKTQNYCGKLHVCAFILEPHCLIKLFLRIWLHSFRDRLPFKENNHHLWTIVLFRCITIWAKGVFCRETQSKESHIYSTRTARSKALSISNMHTQQRRYRCPMQQKRPPELCRQ
jgi:hypothetical protein